MIAGRVMILIIGLTPATLVAEVRFERRVIDGAFRAEACAAADINRDGLLDVVAGENWYEAPTFHPHRFRTVAMVDGYADIRLDAPADINGDGWVDLITVRRERTLEWLENPRGREVEWTAHSIGESHDTEGVIVADINGDGRPDVVGPTDPAGAGVGWWDGASDPAGPWRRTIIGRAGGDAHGIGFGDMNRDGRVDILTRFGWYEQPANPHAPDWAFHHHNRGQTHRPVVYDFDGDGDQDFAASSPHNYGLWWWQQVSGDEGTTDYRRHLIDDTISQLHELVGVDMDGDGDRDLLTGKRYKAHHGRDPGSDDPALLAWYKLTRDGTSASFKRHIIDDDSGLGYVVTPVDIDRDGDIDVLTSNQKGVFLFERKGSPELPPLFNGKNLDNWIGDKELWTVQDGVIVGRTETGLKHNNFLVSREQYDNFVLTLDIKLEPDSANSGIQFRSTPRDDGEVEGYQADVGKGWWGSIYEELGRGLLHDGYKSRGQKAVVPEAWNHYVIYAVGSELRVEINGTVCTHLRDGARTTGHIALQIHSGGPTDVRFKNIVMRAIRP